MTEFPGAVLDRLRSAVEVRIETSATPDAMSHRTIIWIVVDARHRVLVRSVRGDRGRWYREALANPDCTVWIGHESVAVRAVPASDPARVASASAALTEKYAADPALRSMLREEVLASTLELLPRGGLGYPTAHE